MSNNSKVQAEGHRPPLIVHVIWRLSIGGLENGLVNLINRMPADQYRHAIICLDRSTAFRDRIERHGVEVIEIRKKPGHDLHALLRLFRAIKRLKPDIVHTRNTGALDALLPALMAGVKIRIHGEHGWNINDLRGTSRKQRWLRKIHAPMVSKYVAVSHELRNYLVDRVGVNTKKVVVIANGVDTERFRPNPNRHRRRAQLNPAFAGDTCVIGTAGRMDPVKDHVSLAAAFIRLVQNHPECSRARLAIIGGGEMQSTVIEMLHAAGLENRTWIPGRRDDIHEIISCFDVFVQCSLAEGISNTILEAMASGVPVIATDVGGNPELVRHDSTGTIIPPADTDALVAALRQYVLNERLRSAHGEAGRARAVEVYDLDNMLHLYSQLYDGSLERVQL